MVEVNKVNDGTDQMPENGVEEKKETMEQATEKEAKGKAKIGKKKKETPPQETEAIQALNMKLAQLEQEKEEYLQSYLRLRADFENYKRRTRQELQQAAAGGKEELLLELLPVLDNLERALASTGDPEQWRSGVEMIFRQFLNILAQTGLKPIPAVGESFDPQRHEAMLREPSSQPENTILEELKKGYLFGEKTLRPSLVKVAAFDPDLVGAKEKE